MTERCGFALHTVLENMSSRTRILVSRQHIFACVQCTSTYFPVQKSPCITPQLTWLPATVRSKSLANALSTCFNQSLPSADSSGKSCATFRTPSQASRCFSLCIFLFCSTITVSSVCARAEVQSWKERSQAPKCRPMSTAAEDVKMVLLAGETRIVFRSTVDVRSSKTCVLVVWSNSRRRGVLTFPSTWPLDSLASELSTCDSTT